MEDDHFSFGGADGQALAEAELMHTINQVLQSMRCPNTPMMRPTART